MTKQQPVHFDLEEDWWPEDVRGPMLVVSLDDDPDAAQSVGPGELYILDGRMWVWEEPGCALCNEDDSPSRTLHTVDDNECRCLKHGELIEVPYIMKRRLEVSIGPITRSSTEEMSDSMLFPVSMSEEDLRRSIEEMLGPGESDDLERDSLSGDGD